jgi:hypothetical protein
LLIQLAHIEMGLAVSPNDTSFLRSHAFISAEVGRFQRAAADMDKLIAINPDDLLLYMLSACAHAYTGDQAGYRDVCKRMVQRFSKTNDLPSRDKIAKSCLLAPGALDDLVPVVEMARSMVSGPSSTQLPDKVPSAGNLNGLFQLCAAMADYRTGNYQQALDRLGESTQRQLGIEPRATAVLFRAMADYRLHHEDDARSELERAHTMFERIARPDADVIEAAATIQDWMICQIVRREAEQLISGGADH